MKARTKNKSPDTQRPDRYKSKGRAAISNGCSQLSSEIDGRSQWSRRFRDLVNAHLSDLGGESNVSQAQLSLVRRAAAQTVELERLETRFAQMDGAGIEELDRHQRIIGSLRRTLESLGLDRKANTVDQSDGTARLIEAIRGGL